MKTILLSCVLAVPSFAEHILNAGGGLAHPAAGFRTYGYHNSGSIEFGYAWRFVPFLQAEAGLDIAFARRDEYYRSSSERVNRSLTFVPAGLRGIVPLSGGRAELSAGIGGAYLFHSRYDSYSDSAMICFTAGTHVYLGRSRRWQAGASARWFRDTGRPTEQWLNVYGEVRRAFGRRN